jgi:hypothetical protein
MVECQPKCLCYKCDEKYFMGHKCKEKNPFMAISKEISEEDGDVSPSKEPPQVDDHIPPFDPLEVEPLTSLNVLIGIFAP